MRITTRLAKLESFHRVGPDGDGACGYCRGRTDLGRTVVFNQCEDGPVTLRPGRDASPTPCPRCGRDMNITVIVHRTRQWQVAAA